MYISINTYIISTYRFHLVRGYLIFGSGLSSGQR